MNVMIYIKWLTDWTGRTSDAPSLITTLINLFLGLGKAVDLIFLFP